MFRRSLLILFVLVVLSFSTATIFAQDTACESDEVTLRLDDWSSGDRVEYMTQVLAALLNPTSVMTRTPAV